MLIAKETSNRDIRRPSTGFRIGETVMVRSLGKVGQVIGADGGLWLVQLTEGDAPIPCDADNLERRQTLMG